MIQSSILLKDLQAEVTKLEDDLRARCDAEPSVNAPLQAQYEAARAQKRTAQTYKAWREDELTNVAVAWVLACVFIRFLEDNGLVETLYLAGPNAEGVARARDQHELFFRQHPELTEREYLEHVFKAMEGLPGLKEFFDRRHNPLWSVGPTGDAAAAFLNFWRKTNPETGRPVHEFSDPTSATRFLGDLYQDLSEAARKRYALLQTPVFVEEFILDRTLSPAIETFGFRVVRMIDPTCGSGHFLLGGFARLHRLWVQAEPAEAPAVLVQRALDQVFGVDLNPNVVAIARFRLLIAALQATGTTRLRDAFNFRINVTTGDALLHGRRFGAFEHQGATQRTFDTEETFRDELKHHYEVEDTAALHRILGQQYHAVVGNPPYITVKDRAVSELYRDRYPSCAGKYSLSVPFMERFFDLAVTGDGTPQHPAGFVGQITANSFMKREFGKKLIEEFLPRWDLTHVLDTAGAYIPGHGTPTVILFGKNQPPVSGALRTVLGIRGEPFTPEDPALGLVWQAVLEQIDLPGSESEWMSAADSPREKFFKHPWSIGGGGAAELKEILDKAAVSSLGEIVDRLRGKPNIGITAFTLEDDVFIQPQIALTRQRVPAENQRIMIEGDTIRDWFIAENDAAVWPYDERFEPVGSDEKHPVLRFLWTARTCLANNVMFGQQTKVEAGLNWYEFGRLTAHKLKTPFSITFGEIASHNHFVLDRGGKVFKQTAPVIKLKAEADENDHLRLLGLLNSSLIGFMMKQTSHQKQMTGGDGVRVDSKAKVPYQFGSTQLHRLPIPTAFFEGPLRLRLLELTKRADAITIEFMRWRPKCAIARIATRENPAAEIVRESEANRAALRSKLILLQEQIDFTVYAMFGLTDDSLLGSEIDDIGLQLETGQRPFEIVDGENINGFAVSNELPACWNPEARAVWTRRISAITENTDLRLIEDPHYKRRWIGRQGLFNHARQSDEFKTAARDWLLARLEGYFFEGQRVCTLQDGFNPAAAGFAAAKQPALTTTSQLSGTVQTDAAFLAVAEQLMGGPGYSVPKLVRELVESAAVPFLPTQRYKPAGLLKRQDWEHVWDLQRREDAIDLAEKVDEPNLIDAERAERKAAAAARKKDELGDIPVPPKYGSGDFKKSVWWSLRGKLDVPKERWISYPGAERTEDPSPVIAWAGWDQAQQARALAEYYVDAKQNFGFTSEKLKLLLAGLLELEPWLSQWHGAVDPLIGDSPANAIRAFLDAECHAVGITRADLETIRMGANGS